MPAVLEAFFRLHDNVTRPLSRLRREFDQTERSIHETTRELNDLERKLDRLNRSVSTPKIYADKRAAERDIRVLQAKLAELERKRTTIEVDIDTRSANRGLARLAATQASLRSIGGGRGFGHRGNFGIAALVGISSLIPILTAAIPLAQQLGLSMAGLLPIFGALGAGVGLFAAAAIPFFADTIKGYKAVKKAEEELRTAENAKERAEALKKLREAQKELSPIQKTLISQVKELGKTWREVSAPLTDAVANISVSLTRSANTALAGIGDSFKPFARLFEKQGNRIADFFADPKQIEIMNRLLRGWVPILESVGNSFGNLFRWLQAVTLAAQPLGLWMSRIFEAWTNGIADRAEGNIEGMRKKFVGTIPTLKLVGDFIRDMFAGLKRIGDGANIENALGALRIFGGVIERYAAIVNESFGPRMNETFRNIGDAIIGIAEPMSKITGFILDGLNALAAAFRLLPGPIKQVIAAMVALALTMRIFGLGGALVAGIGLLGRAFLALIPAIRAATVAMLAFNASNPVGWVALAATAIAGVTLAILASRDGADQSVPAWKRLRDEMANIRSAADRARNALLNLRDARLGLSRSEIAYERAVIARQRARDRVKELARSGKKGTPEYREAELDALEANNEVELAGRDRARSRATALRRIRESRLADAGNRFRSSVGLRRREQELSQLYQNRSTIKEKIGSLRADSPALPRYKEALQETEAQIARTNAAISSLTRQQARSVLNTQASRKEFAAMLRVVRQHPGAARELTKALLGVNKVTPNLKPYADKITAVLENTRLTTEQKMSMIRSILAQQPSKPDLSGWEAHIAGAINRLRASAGNLGESLSRLRTSTPGRVVEGTGRRIVDGVRTIIPSGRDATGNIHTSPTVRLFAERGPEAIIPLGPGYRQQRDSLLRRTNAIAGMSGAGSGAGVTINFGTVNIGSGDDMDSFVARVEDAVRRAMANTPHVDTAGLYA